MRHPTDSFKELRLAVRTARKIVARVPKATLANASHELKIRSYIILLHSAFEEYLERVSVECMDASIDRFMNDRSVNAALYSAICYYKTKYWWHRQGASNDHFDVIKNVATEIRGSHASRMEDVHGIRHGNQNVIFHPVGIDIQNFDPALMAALDGFGIKRGNIAHKMSITVKETRSSIDSDVTVILGLLKNFDKELCRQFGVVLV